MPDPKTIVLVEDDDGIRETMAALLEDEGFAVLQAANGEEGLARLRAATDPCLVLLDLWMPVMNGWQTAEELHHRYGRTIPIIVVTAAEHAEGRAREIDADGVLAKPFEVDDLLRIVSHYLGHPAPAVVHRDP